METRQATNPEIFHAYRNYRRPRFRHFTHEIYNPRAANGVSHRRYSSAKLRDIDGVPHVQHGGQVVAVRATYYTLDSGSTFVSDLRLDSEYLT